MSGKITAQLAHQLKEAIKDNRKLYALARGMKGALTEERYQLLRGYYEESPDLSTVMIHHRGDENPGKIIYEISSGEDVIATQGFCALLRRDLLSLGYAERMGWMPVIKWGRHTHYYEPSLDARTQNAFDYYFEPVSEMKDEDCAKSKNVILADLHHVMKERKAANLAVFSSYQVEEDEIRYLAGVYRKYIRLNDDTRGQVFGELQRVLKGRRTVGIHIRGTDYKKQFRGHPVTVRPEEHLREAKRLLTSGEYEQVFLATDDLDALRVFQQGLPAEQLVYFDDTLRGQGNVGTHFMEDARALHHYKLGLEILRDVYTLAHCDSLIAGLSQVSFAARYINLALGRSYRELILLDNGINANGKEIPGEIKL